VKSIKANKQNAKRSIFSTRHPTTSQGLNSEHDMMSEGGHSSVRAVVVMNIKEQPYASAYPQDYS